jgi:hypothetical protein
MAITLHEITQDNWRECARLDPGSAKQGLHPVQPLCAGRIQVHPSLLPLAIYWVDRMAASSYAARSPSRIAAIAPTA